MNISYCLQMFSCYQPHRLLMSSQSFNFIQYNLSFLVANSHIYTRIPHPNHVNSYHRYPFHTFLLQHLDFPLNLIKHPHSPVRRADRCVLLKSGDRISEAVLGLRVEGLRDTREVLEVHESAGGRAPVVIVVVVVDC
jgi:hypothetical protein